MSLNNTVKSFRELKKIVKGLKWLEKKLFDHNQKITYEVCDFPEVFFTKKDLQTVHKYLTTQEVEAITEELVKKLREGMRK